MTRANTQMIDRLKKPERAGWIASHRVTYEIFMTPGHKELAHLDKKIIDMKNSSVDSWTINGRLTTQEAEKDKQRCLARLGERQRSPETLLGDVSQETERYKIVKKYFEDKIKALGLKNPLIFFDDVALRIDIGYPPSEFDALFSDFFWGVFRNNICAFSIFQNARAIFVEDSGTKEYQSELKAEKNRLLLEAEKSFQNLPAKKKTDLPDSPTETAIIKQYLLHNRGFVIGEVHEHKSPKQFLIDNMPLLKSKGVTTIYMEHLLHERHQAMLDHYMRSPIDEPLPKELEIYLRHQDEKRDLNSGSNTATFIGIVEYAKKNGIRIVAIDSEASYQIVGRTLSDWQDDKITQDRCRAMNMSVLEHVKKNNDGGKFVVFVGSAHVATYLGVPGVSDLLGCPNIVVHDFGTNHNEESFKKNAIHGTKEKTVQFDILYHRSSGAKHDAVYELAVSKFFEEHPPKKGSFWHEKEQTNISLKDIVRHALGENDKGFFSGYSGSATKIALRDDYQVEFDKTFEALPIDEKVKHVCEKITKAPLKKLAVTKENLVGPLGLEPRTKGL